MGSTRSGRMRARNVDKPERVFLGEGASVSRESRCRFSSFHTASRQLDIHHFGPTIGDRRTLLKM